MCKFCVPAFALALVVSAIGFGSAADDKHAGMHEDCT